MQKEEKVYVLSEKKLKIIVGIVFTGMIITSLVGFASGFWTFGELLGVKW